MDRVRQLIDAFRRDPSLIFSDGDLALLAGVADRELWAAKAVMLRHVEDEAYELCLPLLERIVAAEPTRENIYNLFVGLRSLGRYEEAIACLRDHEATLDRIAFCDLMSSLAARVGRVDEAVRYGDESLALKDDAAPAAPMAKPKPSISTFDPDAPSRNIVAFSIWGTLPRYLEGAVANSVGIRYLYPGWTARFYTDRSTPPGFVEALKGHGAQVVVVEDRPAATHGLFWRFMVEDDEGVDLYLVRDCDSVVNIKERWAVGDWLARGRAFHVMRDHPAHCELILAGMWGAHRGNIGDMAGRVDAYLAARGPRGHDPTIDQKFTRQILWPIVRNDVVLHDSWFSFGDPVRYSTEFALPARMHVGQDEWTRWRRARRASEAERTEGSSPGRAEK